MLTLLVAVHQVKALVICNYGNCCKPALKFNKECTKFLDPRAAAILKEQFCTREVTEKLSRLICETDSPIDTCQKHYIPDNFDDGGWQDLSIGEDFEDFASAREHVCDLIPLLFTRDNEFEKWKAEHSHGWIRQHSIRPVSGDGWEETPFE